MPLLSSLPGITCKPVSAEKSGDLAERIAKALVTDIYESTQYDGFDINLEIMHWTMGSWVHKNSSFLEKGSGFW